MSGWGSSYLLPAFTVMGLGGVSSPPADTMLVRVTTLSCEWPPPLLRSFLLMVRLVSGDHSCTGSQREISRCWLSTSSNNTLESDQTCSRRSLIEAQIRNKAKTKDRLHNMVQSCDKKSTEDSRIIDAHFHHENTECRCTVHHQQTRLFVCLCCVVVVPAV